MSSAIIPYIPIFQNDIDKGKKTIFRIKITDLYNNNLLPMYDGTTNNPYHVSIQPSGTMSEVDYKQNILNTRNLWEPVQKK